ncbi:MAG: hypothetical protein ING72_08570 [Methylobacterium sp.]|nr:hypothetical protein [Methylobacterium sp.]
MRFTIQRPDLGTALAETEKDIERAVTSGMRDAADGLKQDLRENVVAAGLGERLSRTWRGKTFPEVGKSAEAAAYVWSRAPKIVDAFDRGVVIRSARGLFLAIPTAAAGKSGRSAAGSREKITPEGWRRRTGLKLRFVYRRGRPSLLVADDARINMRGLAARNRRKTGKSQTNLASVIVFILVPQVALKKRLDVESAAKRQAARVPSLIAGYFPQS